MKTKLELAHEYAMLHMMNPQYKDVDDLEVVQWAWDYVEAMQAEADERSKAEAEQKRKEMREMLNAPNTFIEREGQHFDDVNWQPDWSQAPEWAVAWTFDRNGATWWSETPVIHRNMWFIDYGIWECEDAPSFNYSGNWRDSLRKRP